MKPHDLKPAAGSHRARKRVGRGEGSGKGKTAGRGTKGTKARSKVPMFFEGGQMPLTRRIPKLKGFTPPVRTRYGSVNVGALAAIEGSSIGPDELRAAGLVRKHDKLVKLLGNGEVGRALTVRAHAVSESARSKIEAAGGSVELLPVRREPTEKAGKGPAA
ncbi:MAG TPA: 50S ribosomal protein L15 [Actinomycetota bacterium]|nr:50S ribosomal protein L15 [Actinomycetota bacterium]